MIYDFRDARATLDPVSAFITGYAWQDSLWYVQHLEDPVLDGQLSRLLREPLGLLFLSKSDAAELGQSLEFVNREILPVDKLGILLFHGRGVDRWRDGITAA